MTVRVKLALLYGVLFLVAGAALLGISYQLVAHNLPEQTVAAASGSDVLLRAGKLAKTADVPASDREVLASIEALPPDKALEAAKAAPLSAATARALLAALPTEVRSDALHQLLVQSAIALGVMAVVSVVLGWLVAGRVLRPVTRITETARRLSASNLDERIDLHGPDDELTRLADTFDAMLDRLAAAFEGQRRFVANASHELRTPLTIMATELDVTLARPDASVDELRHMGATVRTAVDRSDRLITSLLALAQVEEGLDVTQTTNVAVLAREALARHETQLAERGLDVQTQLEPVVVNGDPGLLDRLLDNLLDNAARYNVDNGWVRVTTRPEAGVVEVAVASSGRPIAAEEVDELFAPFRRLEARTGSQRGMGLGLSIVRAIARAHGGTATATPIDAGGLCVTVRLPGADVDQTHGCPDQTNPSPALET